ncbi:MAG: DUF2064 domain-containing protein, partial [Methylomonas sp.]|nr:DUF2064 domain-containing protein [Methylomonas sp.]
YDAVFAPAEDGGYVLVGLNEPHPELFENMLWGESSVMTKSRFRAAQANLTVHELQQQWDVDDIAGWKRFLALEAF